MSVETEGCLRNVAFQRDFHTFWQGIALPQAFHSGCSPGLAHHGRTYPVECPTRVTTFVTESLLHDAAYTVTYLVTSFRCEYTSVQNAVCVHKLLLPGLVLPGVVEYREQFVSSVAFYLAHGIVALPSEVLVDEYQVELAVVGITVSLDLSLLHI